FLNEEGTMHRMTLAAALVSAALTGASAQEATTKAAPNETTQQLIDLDQELSTAATKNDVAALGRILANSYVSTNLAGEKVTRARSLELAKSAHRGAIKNDDYNVRVIGNTAIMTHRSTETTEGKADVATVTHVWMKRGANWQIVADQYT